MSSTSPHADKAHFKKEQVTALSAAVAGLHNTDTQATHPWVYSRSGTSPLSRLPDEILSKIFVCCDGEQLILPVPTEMWTSWTQIGLVCSHWRNVLWSSPYLLNHIIFDQSWGYDNSRSQFRDFVGKLFSRNDGLLSLEIYGDSASSTIGLIAPHSHRIRHLLLDFVDEETLLSLFKEPPGLFSQLEHLSIDGPTLTYSEIIPLHTAPNLRILTITGSRHVLPPVGSVSLQIPFHQLTKLDITDPVMPLCFIYNTLLQCTSLVHLSLHADDTRETQYPIVPILMANLELLEFSIHISRDGDRILQPLICPSLKKLWITIWHHNTDHSSISLQPFISLIVRSTCSNSLEQCGMTEYIIQISSIPPHHGPLLLDSDIKALFKLLPSVTTFNTSFILPPEAFRLVQLGFLPKLEQLYGIVCPDGVHTFLDLVESLVIPNGRQPLRIVSISCRDGPGFEEARERYLRSRQTHEHVFPAQWTVCFPAQDTGV